MHFGIAKKKTRFSSRFPQNRNLPTLRLRYFLLLLACFLCLLSSYFCEARKQGRRTFGRQGRSVATRQTSDFALFFCLNMREFETSTPSFAFVSVGFALLRLGSLAPLAKQRSKAMHRFPCLRPSYWRSLGSCFAREPTPASQSLCFLASLHPSDATMQKDAKIASKGSRGIRFKFRFSITFFRVCSNEGKNTEILR